MEQGASILIRDKKSLNESCVVCGWEWRCRAVDEYGRIESPSARKDELHAHKSKALAHFDSLMEETQVRAVHEGDRKVFAAKKHIEDFGVWEMGGLANGLSSVVYARKELEEAKEQYGIGKEKIGSEAMPGHFVEESRLAEAARLLRVVEEDEKKYKLAGGADEWKASTI